MGFTNKFFSKATIDVTSTNNLNLYSNEKIIFEIKGVTYLASGLMALRWSYGNILFTDKRIILSFRWLFIISYKGGLSFFYNKEEFDKYSEKLKNITTRNTFITDVKLEKNSFTITLSGLSVSYKFNTDEAEKAVAIIKKYQYQ